MERVTTLSEAAKHESSAFNAVAAAVIATTPHLDLIDTLRAIELPHGVRNRRYNMCRAACSAVKASGLSDSEKKHVIETIKTASNPTGWYEESTGITEGIEVLEVLSE